MALLYVYPAKPLDPVTFGDSDLMRQGDQVVALGNPLGLAGTVTTGIVSPRDRSIKETDLDTFMQVNASINPGNSGGPLFNMKGELVGMNTAFFSVPGAATSGSIGLNFAIPANDVKFVIDSLRAHGRVQRGYLGASRQEVTLGLAHPFSLPVTEGAIVAGVLPGTPAADAQLQQGDVLLKIANRPVKNPRDARASLPPRR
jgi:serine protease Do